MGARANDEITVAFPVFNDARTVRRVTEKAIAVCESLGIDYEIVIVDDGSQDRSGAIADCLAEEFERITVVHHETNRGYGAAVRSCIEAGTKPWICLTDGDDEYDLHDLKKLWRLRGYYDLIITFRYIRRYSSYRIIVSRVYNTVLRALFSTSYRDISTGLRLVKREILEELDLQAESPFIGAEIAIKTTLRGFRVGEVGIQTFPREFGKGQSTSWTNIRKTLVDMVKCYRRVFSTSYQLPPSGERAP